MTPPSEGIGFRFAVAGRICRNLELVDRDELLARGARVFADLFADPEDLAGCDFGWGARAVCAAGAGFAGAGAELFGWDDGGCV